MSVPEYNLKWESYHNYIRSGFTSLQEKDEFVDMTLAADGYSVKVHKNLIALASPYLKELIQSIPCPHPIVFLNNVSHKMLSYILEYIYHGEVQVPQDLLNEYIEASKALQLVGIREVDTATDSQEDLSTNKENCTEQQDNFAAHITINTDNFNLEVKKLNTISAIESNTISTNQILGDDANNFSINENIQDPQQYSIDIDSHEINESVNHTLCTNSAINNDKIDIQGISTNVIPKYSIKVIENNDQFPINTSVSSLNPEAYQISAVPCTDFRNKQVVDPSGLVVRYTVSNRGALQLIINRFMYYNHHKANEGHKQRWRCIDYRRKHCRAFIDTEGQNVVKRMGIHNHPNHDSKIEKKVKSGMIYKTLAGVEQSSKYNIENN